jgi:glycosyltransferase involved in cell wall biosynthesis
MQGDKIKILWVCHDFPPRRSSGMYRPIKLYKYIDKNKFEIHFLTQSVFFRREDLDKGLLEELIPKPGIYRLPNIVFDDFIFTIYDMIRDKKNKPQPAGRHPIEKEVEDHKLKVAKGIYRLFIMFFYFPDEFFMWGLLGAIRALWLHHKHRYDLVYTTSHPESGHLAGCVLKILGVKWVADYRDGGILWHKSLLGYPKINIREKIDFYYQMNVLGKADHVITHSETLKNQFCKVFSLDPSKISAISNGYDEDDFKESNIRNLSIQRKDDEVHLLHVGTWYLNDKEVSKVVNEMNWLQLDLKEKGYSLTVHAIGIDILKEDQKCNSIGFRYNYHGVVSHGHVTKYLLAADAYLLPVPNFRTSGVLPGKLWEYLRGGKPIILFGPKDEAWNIIDELGVGIYMGLDGEDRITADSLLGALEKVGHLNPQIPQYSWESRAHLLQDVFLRVASGKG